MELHAEPRTELGKQVKTLRKKGFLPAVVYGEGVSSQSISLPSKQFEKVYREAGESTVLTLVVNDTSYNVLIHDVMHDTLKGTVLHADFLAVRMDKEICTTVPIVFEGESPAVKNEGGILIKVVQELEVEALPKDLPHELTVDLAQLSTLESRISVKDIIAPLRVKILADPEEPIAIVEAPRSEEELKAELEVAPEAAIKEVETEQEVKRAAKAEKATEEGEEKSENSGGAKEK